MEKDCPVILPVQQTGKSTEDNGTSPAAYSPPGLCTFFETLSAVLDPAIGRARA
jgi:hypothetical protein